MQRHLVVGAVTTLLLAGCGDPDDPPPEPPSYYAQLGDLTGTLDDANSAADEELHTALDATPPRGFGDLFARVTDEAATRHEAAIAEMAELEPPESARAAHDALLATSRELVDQDRAAAEEMAGLSAEQLGARRPSEEYAAAEAAADEACAELQQLAERAGADVDLCVGLYAP